MANAHGGRADMASARRSAPRRSAPRRRKPERVLAPVAAAAASVSNQQREVAAVNGGAADGGQAIPVAPLELVFADTERRVVRSCVDLRGFRVSDQWLARARSLLPASASGSVRSLALDDSARSVSARALQGFLNACAPGSLRCLHLASCPGLDASAVALDVVPTTLVELDVSACEWVDDQFARVVARRCPMLTTAVFARCRRITDYGVAAFADPSAITAKNVEQRRLTSLDISFCTKVTDSGVLALLMAMATAGLRLRELRAAGLPLVEGFNLLGLPRFGSSGASIEALSLAMLSNLRVSAIATLSIIGALANVREIDLSSCSMVDDEALQALCIRSSGQGGSIGGCPHLVTLKLAFCSSITDAGVSILVGSAGSTPMTSSRPTTSGSKVTRSAHVQLRRIDLTGCFQLTDDGVVSLAEACTELQVLVIDGVRRIGAKGVYALAQHCPKLHTIHWGGILVRGSNAKKTGSASDRGASAATTNDDDFFSIPQLSAATIAGLELATHLHTLHIGNTQCDVDALASRLQLSSQFGSRFVDLDVTGIATDALCHSIGASCANLRSLRLSRSRYFSESSFLRVAAGCRRLESLDLESCEQIRDASLEAISANCPLLERLNLANDWQITDRGIAAVGAGCKWFKALNVRHCPEVSLFVLRSVASKIGNNLLIASADGLALKHRNVVAFLRGDNARRAAARKITRWMKPRTTTGRRDAKSALLLAIAWIRYRKRCVIRIQRCFRRFLGIKRQRELLLNARRARVAKLAVDMRLLRAYCALTRLLRTSMRQWLAEKQRQAFLRAEAARLARESAATCIQRHVRGCLARRRAAAIREKWRLERERRVIAAVDIQRLYRGFKSREHALETRAKLGRVMRAKMRECEGYFAIAIHMQCIVRGALGRRRAQQRTEELAEHLALREASAKRIQRAFRAFVVRVAFRNLLFRSTSALQRVYRGFIGRKHAREIVLVRSYALEPFILMLRGGRVSIFTRELAVSWKRKRDAGLVVAENLQRLYRGAVGRVLFRVTLATARQHEYLLDSSACALQHFFRGLLIIKRIARFGDHLHLRRRSATAIQATWRMWQAKALAFALRLRDDRRCKHRALLRSMTASDGQDDMDHSDQSRRRPPRRGHHRSLLDEAIAKQQRQQQQQQIRLLMSQSRPRELPPLTSLRLLQLGAIHSLVRFYRAQLLLRGWQSPSFIRLLNSSATRIQAIVRGYLARTFARAFRCELEAVARLVQRVWRGKLGKQAWRRLIEERCSRQRELDEQDRAGRVAHKRSSQLALEALDRDARYAVVLQRWYRTLRNRQVFRECREARILALDRNARSKLANVLKASVTGSVVFQARAWRDCVDNRAALLELEDDQVAAMERELRELQRECLSAHVGAAQAAMDAAFLAKRRSDVERSRAGRVRAVEALKKRIQLFSAQAKQLTLESARVHGKDRQLRRDLQGLEASVDAFRTQLRATLPMEPLLLPADVERLLALLPDAEA